MKTFATYALMATALAVKLHMLEQEAAEQTETERVMDMTVEDFTGEEWEKRLRTYHTTKNVTEANHQNQNFAEHNS